MARNNLHRTRWWLASAVLGGLLANSLAAAAAQPAAETRGSLAKRPNVVLVITDDQGYGDLGCHGNKIIKTPALDRLYAESIRLSNFHVDPTCSPTRSALLTGRYSCRTGVWHTIMGRSLLRRDEKTFGDLFTQAGYRTAVFGKWHLGDNYPYRAVDRGFQESLVHGGGGIGQTPDYWGNNYFNPVLSRNGKPEKSSGYCTDVFFDAAIEFIDASRQRPFFVYLPTNVPHGPYQVAEKYSGPYRQAGAAAPLAQFYGIIANLDENLARLLARLDQLGLAENTIVIFMTDNGTSGGGFNAGMRGRKGSAYEGGHRVPCFIRWPARLKGGIDVPQLTAHIDLLPTLLELCDVRKPPEVKFDGKSLLPLLLGVEDWAPRTLFVQSHRIEHPQPWRQSAVMTRQYRLVNGRELYDVEKDPEQVFNIGPENPEIVDKLRFLYEEWYKDVSARFGEYCPIVLGSPRQNPTVLTCHDWHESGAEQVWDQRQLAGRPKANGFWAVEVERAGRYRFTLRERPVVAKHPLPAGVARLKIGQLVLNKAIEPGATGVTFEVDLKPGETRLETWLAETGGEVRGAFFVEVEYLGPPLQQDGKRGPQEGAAPPSTRPKPQQPGAYP